MIIVVLPSLTQKEWLAYLLGGVMPRTYRRFSREFKMQIVDSILKGAVAGQIAKANDLHPEVVRKLVRDFKTYYRKMRSPAAAKHIPITRRSASWNASWARWPPKTSC